MPSRCAWLCGSKREYASTDGSEMGYPDAICQKIVSDPYRRNGLYWSGRSEIPVIRSILCPSRRERVHEEGDKPFRIGVYFKILKGPGANSPGGPPVTITATCGGVCVGAWLRSMLFRRDELIVNQNGTLIRRLGLKTGELAKA